MRVVLDSNILLSALISSKGSPDVIYRAWRASRFEVVTSRMQLDEIRRASRYPKFQAALQPAQVGAMINYLSRAVVLERLKILAEADDPDDAFLLAMAVEGDADYLVTGDHRAGILQLGNIGRARIVTPTQFREEVLLLLARPSHGAVVATIQAQGRGEFFSHAGRGSTADLIAAGCPGIGAAAPPPHASAL